MDFLGWLIGKSPLRGGRGVVVLGDGDGIDEKVPWLEGSGGVVEIGGKGTFDGDDERCDVTVARKDNVGGSSTDRSVFENG